MDIRNPFYVNLPEGHEEVHFSSECLPEGGISYLKIYCPPRFRSGSFIKNVTFFQSLAQVLLLDVSREGLGCLAHGGMDVGVFDYNQRMEATLCNWGALYHEGSGPPLVLTIQSFTSYTPTLRGLFVIDTNEVRICS